MIASEIDDSCKNSQHKIYLVWLSAARMKMQLTYEWQSWYQQKFQPALLKQALPR